MLHFYLILLSAKQLPVHCSNPRQLDPLPVPPAAPCRLCMLPAKKCASKSNLKAALNT